MSNTADKSRNGLHHCEVISDKSGEPTALGEFTQEEETKVRGITCNCDETLSEGMTVRQAKILIAYHQHTNYTR